MHILEMARVLNKLPKIHVSGKKVTRNRCSYEYYDHDNLGAGMTTKGVCEAFASSELERARSRARFNILCLELSHVSQMGLFCAYQRSIDKMLAQKPHLQFVRSQYIAHDQIIGPFVFKF